MKYTDVDMQDMQSQSSLQVQYGDTETPDHGTRRNRSSDATNNNSAKAAPEVIDLDGEDVPKENEEVPLSLNGMTTVRKVSLPWQKSINLNIIEKKSSEACAENPPTECPASERSSITSKELPVPAEAEVVSGSKAVQGGSRLKRNSSNERHKVVKKTSIDKKDGKVVVVTKKRVVGTDLTSSQHQGERKRSCRTEVEEIEPKRPKIESGAQIKVSSSNVATIESESKESSKTNLRDSSEVSLVDLVEEDDDQEKSYNSKGKEKGAISDGPVKIDCQTGADNTPTVVVPSKSDNAVLHAEKKIPVSAAPVGAMQGQKCVHSSGSVILPGISSEEKRTSLSSSIPPGKNGLISQIQSIEVKKVKLRPELEKQATAMSAVESMSLSPVVASPKQTTSTPKSSTGASSLAQKTASNSEINGIPSLASSKSLESIKDEVSEGSSVPMGCDLEKKVGLNPVYSETRKVIGRLTREELESYFLDMACQFILQKSEVGRYRILCEEMKESCEKKENKIAHLNKQLVDLSAVVHRAINESKEKRNVVPSKITRSVGIQLEQSQIFAAMKNKNREDRGLTLPPSSSTSSTCTSDRIPPTRFSRPGSTSASKTPPSTPNGLITAAGIKNASRDAQAHTKSPQRQLKALHPRIPQSAAQCGAQAVVHPPSTTSAHLSSDPSVKRHGFMEITEGGQIGVRRHRSSNVAPVSTSGSSGSSGTPLSTLSTSQVMPHTLKVVPSHYAHTATNPASSYTQPGGNTRVVTATTMAVPSGTPISSPHVAYFIPTSSPIAVQQRQIVITSTNQSQQIRGRSPITSMPPMIMRANTTLVQVPSGSIPTASPTLIRAVQPTAAPQMLATENIPAQQQASRMLAMTNQPSPAPSKISFQHPAPLPSQPQPTVVNANLKPIPRRPVLKLSKVLNGIVLSWNMTTTTPHEEIASYQLYAYQEGVSTPPSPLLWKKVGDVKALPLPMACTLTQFADGHTYHFAVRAVDVHGRVGEFSVPGTIDLFG